MSRTGSALQDATAGAGAPWRWVDAAIRAAAGVTVVGLASAAGAISYSHMRALAAAHGEAGWQAHTFPLSVDGIEVVASLVLLADRRAGRASGWLPWAALAAGTTASLAANVAAAETDLIGRVVAGWPAVALLVAVKLCSRLLEPRPGGDVRPAGAPPRPVAVTRGDGPSEGQDTRRGAPAGGRGGDGGGGRRAGTATARPVGDGGDVAGLLPTARVAAGLVLARDGTLTRDGLAAQLRRDGHAVRNSAVSQILTALRDDPVPQPPTSAVSGDQRPVRVGAG